MLRLGLTISFLSLLIVITNPRGLWAQTPVINSISSNQGTVNEMITISGNNFPSGAANTRVLFGSVAATVLSASTNAIVVEVPAGTTTDNIVVINTSNGLSGSSTQQFFLSYSGDDFDPALLDAEVNYPSGVELFDLCLCDFDNDGKSDVATTKVNTDTDILVYENNSVVETINLSQRNGTTNPELDLGSPTSNITCGDLDGDGRRDLVVSRTGNPRNIVYLLRNISSAGNIQFAPAISLFLSLDDIAKRLEVKDVDMDGKPEIIVSNTFNANLKIFRNTGSPGNVQFDATPVTVNMTGSGTTNGLVVEDINGDRMPDLITNPFFGSHIYVRLNNSVPSNLQFDAVQTIDVVGNLNVLTAGDFNNDGLIDLAVTKTVQDEFTILRNLTEANSSTVSFDQFSFFTDGDPWGIHPTDMDGDGRLDLLVAIRDANNINVFENIGTGVNIAMSKHIVPTNLFSRNIMGGDMDGDAIPDIVFTSFDASPQYALGVIRNANCFAPVVDPPGPLTVCPGGSVNLMASKGIGITYTWDKDNVVFKSGPEDTIIVTQPGVYKVLAESASGACSEVSNAVIVNSGAGIVPADPVIYNEGPFCQGGEITLTTDTIVGATYLWQGPNSFTSNNQNITIANASVANAGTYSLQVTVGDCSSNVTTTTVSLLSLPSFTITAGGSTRFCEGDSVQLNVNVLSGYTYQWYVDGQSVVGGVGSTLLAKEEGTYHVEATQTSTGCTTSSTNTMDVNSILRPVADFYYTDAECEGNEMQFINSSTFEPGEAVAYSWDFGDGSFIVNNENPVHIYPSEGSFTITFVVAYTAGTCRDTLQSPIEVNPSPLVEILRSPTETICTGDPVSLSTTAPYTSYLWNTGETTRAITVDQPGDYTVSILDANGCAAQMIETVDMYPKPEVTATASPEEANEDAEVQLNASGALTYQWQPADIIDDPSESSTFATVSTTTEFSVVGYNAEGCSDTATVLVRVFETNTINVEPRNVFSPNGDGIDDTWTIDLIENYPGAVVTIYNGDGRIVYESDNYTNEWNAVYNGNDLPETAYFYVIRYEDKNPKTGSVTVIR